MSWWDNFEGVPHADRDRSESVQPLGSAGLSGQGGYSGTPCPTKAALSAEARIAFLERELTEAHVIIGDLAAKLGDKDDVIERVADLSDWWSNNEWLSEWGEGLKRAGAQLRAVLAGEPV